MSDFQTCLIYLYSILFKRVGLFICSSIKITFTFSTTKKQVLACLNLWFHIWNICDLFLDICHQYVFPECIFRPCCYSLPIYMTVLCAWDLSLINAKILSINWIFSLYLYFVVIDICKDIKYTVLVSVKTSIWWLFYDHFYEKMCMTKCCCSQTKLLKYIVTSGISCVYLFECLLEYTWNKAVL